MLSIAAGGRHEANARVSFARQSEHKVRGELIFRFSEKAIATESDYVLVDQN